MNEWWRRGKKENERGGGGRGKINRKE